eukprot:s1030_g9.t1
MQPHNETAKQVIKTGPPSPCQGRPEKAEIDFFCSLHRLAHVSCQMASVANPRQIQPSYAMTDWHTACCHSLRQGRSQAVLFQDGTATPALEIVKVLRDVCVQDPEAQCLLLCAKSELRNPMVAQKVRLEDPALDEALQRVHIKYISEAPVSELLALQALPFRPRVVAASAASSGGSQEKKLCLAACLLLDACHQLTRCTSEPCAALFYESSANIRSAESFLGAMFPETFSVQLTSSRLKAEKLFP